MFNFCNERSLKVLTVMLFLFCAVCNEAWLMFLFVICLVQVLAYRWLILACVLEDNSYTSRKLNKTDKKKVWYFFFIYDESDISIYF